MRGFMGIVAGLVAVGIVMTLISFIGAQLIPTGPADASSVDAIKATYESLSTAARWMIIASWLLGVLAGAALAKRIIGRPWAAWTVAGLFEAYLLLTVLMLPMPGWMQVAALAAPLLAGLLANHLVANRIEVDTEAGTERSARDAEI